MSKEPTSETSLTIGNRHWGSLALMWSIGVNLRIPILAISPLLPFIIREFDLSFAAAGALFALPTLLMGIFAIPGGLLADRFGARRLIVTAMILLTLGGFARAAAFHVGTLFASTFLIGVGIGLIQPSLPKIVRELFPHRIGFATAIYSNGFTIGALVAAAITVPVLLPVAGDAAWRGVFALWTVPAAIATFFVIFWRVPIARSTVSGIVNLKLAARDPAAWIIAYVYFAQSVIFYTLSSWLPTFYQSLGWTPEGAAGLFTTFAAVGVITGLIVPAVSDRIRNRRMMLLISSSTALAGILGLTFVPTTLALLWPVLVGAGIVAVFTMTLMLPADLAGPTQVGTYAGLMLTFGHGASVLGPPAMGALRDLSGSFVPGMIMVAVIAISLLVAIWALPEPYGRAATFDPTR